MLATHRLLAAAVPLAMLATFTPADDALATRADGAHGAVAAEHRLASEAGVEILEAGGNAVDAAVAALLAAGVVNPSSSGLGGGGFMLIYLARERSGRVIDFRETAPHAAGRDLFARKGKAPAQSGDTKSGPGTLEPPSSQRGGLAVAVPGEPRGLAYALEHYGTMTLARVAEPAIRLARDGFPIERFLVDAITRNRDALAEDGTLRVEFLHADGTPYTVGDTIERPALADSLSRLAIEGERKASASPLISGLRLLTGKLLSVSRNAQMRVTTATSVIGIRGTGWYAESDPEQSYFCTCYGAAEIAASNDPGSRETVVATHHDRPLYILGKSAAGRSIRNAPFINHTDQELMLIEALVGREPPFVFPKGSYNAPRRDY